LTRVEFLASAGLNVLAASHAQIAPHTRFGVVANGPATSRPITLLCLDTVFTLYPTLDDALHDLGGGAYDPPSAGTPVR
jgi:anti-sigma B factor antagonist